jgi:hypothetical protein
MLTALSAELARRQMPSLKNVKSSVSRQLMLLFLFRARLCASDPVYLFNVILVAIGKAAMGHVGGKVTKSGGERDECVYMNTRGKLPR